jgi:hypothetical protein
LWQSVCPFLSGTHYRQDCRLDGVPESNTFEGKNRASFYRVYHLASKPKTIMYYGTKTKSDTDPPSCSRLSQPPLDTRNKVTLVARPLLTPVAQKLSMCEHGLFTIRTCVHSGILLRIWIVSAGRDAYPEKDVSNKTTIHRLVTKFRDTGSVCLWQVLMEPQNSWNYGRTNFNQGIRCNNDTWLQ